MSIILGLMIIAIYEVAVNYLPNLSEYTSAQDIAAKLIELYDTEAKKFY